MPYCIVYKYDKILFSISVIDWFNNQHKDSIFIYYTSKLGTLEMATKFNSLRGNIYILAALKNDRMKGLIRITVTITGN